MKYLLFTIGFLTLSYSTPLLAQQSLPAQPVQEDMLSQIDFGQTEWEAFETYNELGLLQHDEPLALTQSYPDTYVSPVVTDTREGLLEYVLGDPGQSVLDLRQRISEGASPFQVVPGLDEDLGTRFPELEEFMDQFPSACQVAAADYSGSLQRLLAKTSELAGDIQATKDLSEVYDKACMTKIDDVGDEELLQVTGVIMVPHEDTLNEGIPVMQPICSATAIGPTEVVTALHCFFQKDLTPIQNAYDALRAGLAEVRFYRRQGLLQSYTIRLPEDWSPGISHITGHNDILVLTTGSRTLRKYVSTPDGPLDRISIPRTAWLIGSNSLINDLDRAKPITDYSRAASPETCAVVHSTDENCLIHSCQSGPSTSGGGLIATMPDRTKMLIGVHGGPIGVANGCSVGDFEGRLLNVAAGYN